MMAWGGIGVLGLALLGGGSYGAYALTRPSWEQTHKDELRRILADADAARLAKLNRAAYDGYDRATTMAAGHSVSDPDLAGALFVAQQSRNALYPQVQQQLAQEAVERAAREQAAERVRQAELARQKQAEQAAAAARAAQDAADRQRVAAESARADQARRLARVRDSDAYRSLVCRARALSTDYDVRIADEDSAYRAISKACDLNVGLLGILARQQAMLAGVDVDAELNDVERRHTVAMTDEDSAIRAVYKHDNAMLDALGVLAHVWTSDAEQAASLVAVQRRLVTDADAALVGDDSAPRAMVAYNDAAMRTWEALAKARGLDPSTAVSAAELGNSGDDSTWRIAERTSDAQSRIALMVLAQEHRDRASTIERSLELAGVGETSALRGLAAKKHAMSQALLALIER